MFSLQDMYILTPVQKGWGYTPPLPVNIKMFLKKCFKMFKTFTKCLKHLQNVNRIFCVTKCFQVNVYTVMCKKKIV